MKKKQMVYSIIIKKHKIIFNSNLKKKDPLKLLKKKS